MYLLFLDDVRNANAFLKDIRTWVTVRTYNDFVALVEKEGLPKFISFDHDLSTEHYLSVIAGDLYPDKKWSNLSVEEAKKVPVPYDKYKEKTGYDCAKWLINYCDEKKLPLPDYQIHSMNPVGKENIKSLLEGYKRVTSKKVEEE